MPTNDVGAAFHANAQKWANLSAGGSSLNLARSILESSRASDILTGPNSGGSNNAGGTGEKEGWFGRGLSLLFAPVGTVAGIVKGVGEVANEARSGQFNIADLGKIPGGAISSAGAYLGSALTGDPNSADKMDFNKVMQYASDVEAARATGYQPNQVDQYLQHYKPSDVGAPLSAIGTGLNIAADPLNFVGVGEITAGIKALKGLVSGSSDVAKAADAAKAATKFDSTGQGVLDANHAEQLALFDGAPYKGTKAPVDIPIPGQGALFDTATMGTGLSNATLKSGIEASGQGTMFGGKAFKQSKADAVRQGMDNLDSPAVVGPQEALFNFNPRGANVVPNIGAVANSATKEIKAASRSIGTGAVSPALLESSKAGWAAKTAAEAALAASKSGAVAPNIAEALAPAIKATPKIAGRDPAAIKNLPDPHVEVPGTTVKGSPAVAKTAKQFIIEDLKLSGKASEKILLTAPGGAAKSVSQQQLFNLLNNGFTANSPYKNFMLGGEKLHKIVEQFNKPAKATKTTTTAATKAINPKFVEAAKAAKLTKSEVKRITESANPRAEIDAIHQAELAKIVPTTTKVPTPVAPVVNPLDDLLNSADNLLPKSPHTGENILPQTSKDIIEGAAAGAPEATAKVAALAGGDSVGAVARLTQHSTGQGVVTETMGIVRNMIAHLKSVPRKKAGAATRATQVERLGKTNSVVDNTGKARFTPTEQHNLLVKILGTKSIYSSGKIAKGVPIAQQGTVLTGRASLGLDAMRIAEEGVAAGGFSPLRFGGQGHFRLTEMLDRWAGDLKITTPELIVKLGLQPEVGASSKFFDKTLADEYQAIKKSSDTGLVSNEGLIALGEKYPSVGQYLRDGNAVQPINMSHEVAAIQAETTKALQATENASLHSTDATNYALAQEAGKASVKASESLGMSREAAAIAAKNVQQEIFPAADNLTTKVIDETKSKLGEASAKGKPSVTEQAKAARAADEQIKSEGKVLEDDPTFNNSNNMPAGIKESISRAWPGLSELLTTWHGYRTLHPVMRSRFDAARHIAEDRRSVYQAAAKRFSKETIAQAENVISKGHHYNDPEVEAAVQFMNTRMGNMFAEATVSNSERIGNSLALRAGLTADEINTHMGAVGLGGKNGIGGFLFPKGDGKTLDWLNAWKDFQPTKDMNMVDFMFRLEHAADLAVAKKGTFAEVGRMFHDPKGISSGVPQLDGFLFPRELVPQIRRLNDVIDETMKPNSKFGNAMDAFLSTWKTSVTIYIPSHHMRNLVGDLSLMYFSGVPAHAIADPRRMAKTFAIMKAHSEYYKDLIHNPEQTQNALKQILEMNKGNLGERQVLNGINPTKGGTFLQVPGKDGMITITNGHAFQMQMDNGVLRHSQIIEDIPGRTIPEIIGVHPLNKKGQKAARKVSESREHLVRVHHWTYEFEMRLKQNVKTMSNENAIHEASQYAAAKIKKWHPDGSDLTNFEQKVMRRIIPFYSWTRKAFPLVAETAALRPARVTLYPKVMYGVADIQGINNQSLDRPFPLDQMFPSWMENLPIGVSAGNANDGYTIINPGNPFTDFGAQYINSPAQGVLSGLNPALRIPMELGFGREAFSGAQIKDTGAYLDKQIPGLSVLNRAGNTDLGFGSLGSTFAGNGPVPTNSTGDAQGVGNGFNIANILTGMGILDASKANYQKQAQLEQKARSRDAKKKAAGGK